MSDTVLLPPVLFAAAEPVDEADDELDGWEQELEDSPRPAHLKRLIRLLVAALAGAAASLLTSVEVPERASLTNAEQTTAQVLTALSSYSVGSARIVAEQAPALVTAITKYVVDATGLRSPLSTEPVLRALTDKLTAGVAEQVAGMRKAATVAVVNWHVANGTQADLRTALTDALGAAEWQVKRTAVSEIQAAYIRQFRAAVTRAGTAKVRRIAMPTACDFCRDAAGVYLADDERAYETHPHCQDLWEPAADDAAINFSRSFAGPALFLTGAAVIGPAYVLGGAPCRI